MGHRLLLSALGALLLGGCQAAEPGPGRLPDDPHRDLTCAECHSGALADGMRASVPRESCVGSGCHEDAGPREVEFRSVSFEHRLHGGDSIVDMSCAGCHTHDEGHLPLTAGVDPCSLCHLTEQAAGNTGECRLCHTSLEHAGETSQGLQIPHEGLPWLEGGCVRCHYDVTQALVDVSVLTCNQCHADQEATVARGIGEDLHASHTGVTCLSCHEGDTHRIQAMSSAVSLECAQCHLEVHAVQATETWPSATTCNACHTGTHLPEQELLLGVVAGLPEPHPSAKFLDGLTCRSCHALEPGDDPTIPVTGSAATCQGCHLEEYDQVLEWWEEGSSDRVAMVQAALRRARADLRGVEAAQPQLDSAAVLVETVEAGGPLHNLRLSHQLLVAATDRLNQAWLDARRSPPPPPDLGREPSMGLCSYCHYRVNDPWLFEEMSGAFHRQLIRR